MALKCHFGVCFSQALSSWSSRSSLSFPSSSSSPYYTSSTNYLSLSLSHTTLQLVLTRWRCWPSMQHTRILRITLLHISDVRCEGGHARRSSLNPNYIFFSSLFFHFKKIYACTWQHMHTHSGIRNKGKWKVLMDMYGCNGKHMWEFLFFFSLLIWSVSKIVVIKNRKYSL